MSVPSEPFTSPVLSPVPRIVAALTARERQLFFGTADEAGMVDWHWLDDAALAAPDWADRLARLKPTVLITGWSTPALPEPWLRQDDCPLRMVCHVTGSVRRLVPRIFLERGGVVTNWGGTVSNQVAEHGLLLALAALRNAAQWRTFITRQASMRQIEELKTMTLFQRRVGLHGFGSVARSLVPLLRPFAVEVSAHSAGVPPELMRTAGVRPAASLEELFSGSEVLFECEALTPATEQSVTARLLALLPDDAIFVNIGRGRIVEESALLREATAGRLRVALDVVALEPLTFASPFVSQPNVILSPHIAGPTADRYQQCGAFALANLQAFLQGALPPGIITLASYDRAT